MVSIGGEMKTLFIFAIAALVVATLLPYGKMGVPANIEGIIRKTFAAFLIGVAAAYFVTSF
jgi:hypothetical protein